MHEVLRFRSAWGMEPGEQLENWKVWFPSLKQQGYAGVEIDFFKLQDLAAVRRLADDAGLEIIALIHTAWPSYEGGRPVGFTAQYLLVQYREQLERAKILRPLKINSHSGSDHLSAEESVKFFRGTLEVDAALGLQGKVSHETHRLRSLFNPYVTAYVLSQVPNLRITADISHFVVVCERLLDVGEEDIELLHKIIPHVHHIHARIGTTQSSQVPEPTNLFFSHERAFFEKTWKQIIKTAVASRPDEPITFTPEYGPYPYHPFGSSTEFSDVADTEGARLQKLFELFANGKDPN